MRSSCAIVLLLFGASTASATWPADCTARLVVSR